MADPLKMPRRDEPEDSADAERRENQEVKGVSGPARSPTASPREADTVVPTARTRMERMSRLQAGTQAVIAAAIVLGALYVARLPVIVLLVSVLLAFVLAPIVDLFLKMRVPRAVGALFALLIFCAALYGLFYVSYNQAVNFAQELPRYSGELRRIGRSIHQKTEKIQQTTANVIPGSSTPKQRTVEVKDTGVTGWVRDNFGSVTETVLMISFIPFLAYFMLSWQEHARTATVMLFRTENRTTAYVTLGLISSMIRSFIVGNVLVGIFIGAVSAVVFGFLHLPYFYFVGFISGFLSLVPYLGVPIAMVPPLVAGIGHIHSGAVVAIGVTVLALHLFSMNVLYPKFLGSRMQLNPLAVTVALLFWGWLWGAMGLILAIPVTAAVKIICDHIEPLRPYGAWLGE